MCQLLDLPNEILQQIVDDIVYIDLENLTLCCKRLHALGDKALLEHRKEKAKYTRITCKASETRRTETVLHPLIILRDVLFSKDVGLYPKALDLQHYPEFNEATTAENMTPLKGELITALRDSSFASGREKVSLIRGFHAESICKVMATVLCLLPNLQSISIPIIVLHNTWLRSSIWDIPVVSQEDRRPQPLSKLVKISIEGSMFNPFDKIWPILNSPSLRSLSIYEMRAAGSPILGIFQALQASRA